MSVICSELINHHTAVACENYDYLRSLELADTSTNSVNKVDLLIELDFYYSFATGESIRGKTNEPIAIKSIPGWIICGTFENLNELSTNLGVTHMYRVNQLESRENNLYDFNETKNALFNDFSYEKKETNYESNEFKNSLKFDELNKRYTCKLPFKDEIEDVPDNFHVSKNRLLHLQKNLVKDRNLAHNYEKISEEYLKEGIIERVNKSDRVTENVHYLPHRPVIKNERGTTKTRIVFDASSKSKGQIF